MKNVASYKAEAVLETDKKVNLIYGLNGTGKSTFSGYLYDMTGEQYREGIAQIEELRNNRFMENYTKETEICLSKIVKITSENISLLKEKIKSPSLVVSVSSLNECEKEIN